MDANNGMVVAKALSKKQQAIIDREFELLEIAKKVVEREGYAHLTMDKVAADSPYSKGTIYNHFNSKEDLVTALGIMAFKKEILLFRRALDFDGNSREKVLAMHVGYSLFTRLEPVLAMCVLTCRTPFVIEKTAPARLEHFNVLEEQMVAIGDAFLQQGLDNGDLVLPAGYRKENVVFANWSMAFGSNALMNNATEACCVSRIADLDSILCNVNLLLDGVNWRPLASEFDYKSSWLRIEQQVFADEVAQLGPRISPSL
ncbi:TetR family transcriptional regulator [Photobacterium aquae]|uniref:TetR family transcriptional regulator n=1 Tax=Photobacterium aquae TaxID=1195763 RepID=A0A0J1GV18_9GAMM|nr:TetR/AcrR family transcriptional regulator [Photobacterium aquae]KLV03580.1 TetR family transcriptional regulator [Photobacterium aquae]